MPRYLELTADLSPMELEHRYRAAHDPVAWTRWHMLWLVAQGYRAPAVAELVDYTANWVREIIRRYNPGGAAGIVDRLQANPGAEPLLRGPGRIALQDGSAGSPPDGGVWTGPKVAAWMADRLDRPVSPQRGWEALRWLGFTPQRSRPRASRADAEAQAAFKKGGSRPSSTP